MVYLFTIFWKANILITCWSFAGAGDDGLDIGKDERREEKRRAEKSRAGKERIG